MEMDINRIGDKIRRILIEKNYKTSVKGGKIWICCPFHTEKSPSCSVTIFDKVYPPGSFYCFGCGEKGGWNKLAQKAGYKFRVNNKEMAVQMGAVIKHDPTSVLRIAESNAEDFLRHNQKIESFTKWPVGMTWRKVGYQFLKDVDAHMLLSPDYNVQSDDMKFEQLIFLPVKVNDAIVGGISAPLNRKRYMNTDGDWVKTKGLFPFDVAKKLLRKLNKKFVVLVEGPRDAARLIQAGIPALAILGSKNWTDTKRDLIMTLSGDDIELVLLFDSDAAGQSALSTVKASCKHIFKYLKVKLPEYTIEEGEKVKCDVFNLPEARFKILVKKLKKRYEFE